MTARLWLTRAGVTLLGTTAAVGVLGAPAQAAATGIASVNDRGELVFTAGSGRANRVTLSGSGGTITVDDRVTVRAGAGCAAVTGDKTRVTCTGVTYLRGIRLGDKNDVFVNRTSLTGNVYGDSGADTLTGGSGSETLYGGSGKDRINGGAGADTIHGGSGDDVIHGDSGNDFLHDGSGADRVYGDSGNDAFFDGSGKDRFYGGTGNDSFNAGPSTAADRYHGGSGTDTVSYYDRTAGVTLDVDGKADDGRKGEKDNIATDIENLTGGFGNDTIHGTNGANLLDGGEGGNDKLYGRGGNDTLLGGPGRDHLDGGAGNDRLFGDPALTSEYPTVSADVMIGGSGVDTVSYSSYEFSVFVDLDGAKGDDGVRGEGDTVGKDVENVIGGYGDDILTGNSANNVLNGGWGGADILRGLGGDDTLLSDNERTGVSDGAIDTLDGGPHVKGDTCGYDPEDAATNCELTK
ncbi:calcium-binding protein [Actinoplanes sp. G11-F43]|uniref:calcium-binding protein n=1 Tax=Actinoplanes sp. G11-F43 TaxID=3424130 RepID=UPI003D354598